jgi:hypothetical protein
MTTPLTIERTVHFQRRGHGRKELRDGAPPACPALPPGRVPREARLLALAHRFAGLIRTGAVRDFTELARLGRVSRARISQVMNVLNLAPAIQEAVLFLPRTERGRDAIILADLQPIASVMNWTRQRRMWDHLVAARLRPAGSCRDT